MIIPSIADINPDPERVWSCSTGQNCRPGNPCCDSCGHTEPTTKESKRMGDEWVRAVGACRRCNQRGPLLHHGGLCAPCGEGEGWVRRTFTVWLDERVYGNAPDDDEIAYLLRMGGIDAETDAEHSIRPSPDAEKP